MDGLKITTVFILKLTSIWISKSMKITMQEYQGTCNNKFGIPTQRIEMEARTDLVSQEQNSLMLLE